MTVFNDDDLAELARQPDLERVDVGRGVTEAGLAHLRAFSSIQALVINEVPMSGDGLTHLEGMGALRDLSLSASAVTDGAFSQLPELPALKMLNASTTSLGDAALRFLSRTPNLQELFLNQSPVTGSGFAAVSGLSQLRNLDVGSCPIDNAGLAAIANFPSLERLNLSGTRITDAGLSSLASMESLEELRLDGAKVTDAGLGSLESCRVLRWLHLSGTAVSGGGLRLLQTALPECEIVAHDTPASRALDGGLSLVVRNEPRLAAPVEESWRRIDAWLAEHAPEILDSLRPPASIEEIRELEDLIGTSLPDDVRESYQVHDGQDPMNEYGEFVPGVLFGLRLIPLHENEGISFVWENFTADNPDNFSETNPIAAKYRCEPDGAIRLAVMRAGWIPLHFSGGREYFGIDLEPGPRGTRGQVIPFSHGFDIGAERKYVLATSWAHFLEDVADELETGSGVINPFEGEGEWFYLRGARNFWNAFPDWSRAKVSRR